MATEKIINYFNPVQISIALLKNKDLIAQFTSREIHGKYKGSILGIFWSLIHPLALLLIYTFVFGMIFGARWPESKSNSLVEYSVTLFCGIIVFGILQECIGRAPTLITANPNLVKKVIFPLEIMPVSVLMAALFHGGIGLLLLITMNLLVNGVINWTLVFLPIILIPLVFLILGLSWFLSSFGVFLKDMGPIINLFSMVWFFLTPVFYSIKNVPEKLQWLMYLNPMAYIVESFRRTVIWGELPGYKLYIVWMIISFLIMMLGYAFFKLTRKIFADTV